MSRPVAVSRNLLEQLSFSLRKDIEFGGDHAFLEADGFTFHASTSTPEPNTDWLEDLANVLTTHGTGIAAAAETILNGNRPVRMGDCDGLDPWHNLPADVDQLADMAATDEWWRMVTGGDAA